LRGANDIAIVHVVSGASPLSQPFYVITNCPSAEMTYCDSDNILVDNRFVGTNEANSA
jgi:hypothetical protein